MRAKARLGAKRIQVFSFLAAHDDRHAPFLPLPAPPFFDTSLVVPLQAVPTDAQARAPRGRTRPAMPRRDARAKILAAPICLALSRCAACRRPAPHLHAGERGLEHLQS
jgi:hypothetical protein